MVKAWMNIEYESLSLRLTIKDDSQKYTIIFPFEAHIRVVRYIEGRILRDLNEQSKPRGTICPYTGKVVS
jgi:hypothetical protein